MTAFFGLLPSTDAWRVNIDAGLKPRRYEEEEKGRP